MTSDNGNRRSLYQYFLEHSGNDLHKLHSYFPVYERYLAQWVGRSPTMLEIGVFKGGSLRMWKEYFGPGARIIGLDMNPDCSRHVEPGIDVLIGDQGSKPFLAGLVQKYGHFDIVLDDGSHMAKHQYLSFNALYSHTRSVYMVEDTHTACWRSFKNFGYPDFLKFAGEKARELNAYWAHPRHEVNERYHQAVAARSGEIAVSDFCRTTQAVHFYDSIVVFEKGEHPEPRVELR